MAKPTDEQLALPNIAVQAVQSQQGELVEQSINLQEYFNQSLQNQNKGLIVYFYPKDNTSGCTTQAQDFSNMADDFDKLGYQIIGISRDGIASHKKFINNHQLTIMLLSDEDEQLCQHFDVIKEKNMYGKKTLGLVRSTFVFNQDGKLTHAQRNLRAKGYAERLYATLAS